MAKGKPKGKPKHCRNKWEVLQRVYEKKLAEMPKPEPPLKRALRTANRNREAIERAKRQKERGNGNGISEND